MIENCLILTNHVILIYLEQIKRDVHIISYSNKLHLQFLFIFVVLKDSLWGPRARWKYQVHKDMLVMALEEEDA